LATPPMIRDHLIQNFGENKDFTLDIALKMKEKMLLDLHECRKEEYQSATGIAILFDRAGGKLTGEMADIIAAIAIKSPYHLIMMEEIKQKWDEWDIKDGTKDNCLQFDFFYHAFAAPFLGCYRCKRTRAAFAALDMDKDGLVDWNEFQVYLKWALHEYPEVKNMEELLTVAFQKGPFQIDLEFIPINKTIFIHIESGESSASAFAIRFLLSCVRCSIPRLLSLQTHSRCFRCSRYG